MSEATTGLLTPADLRAYTGKAHREAQAKVLEADGIPYKRRGRCLVVLWTHVRASIEGRTIVSREPNMDAIV